MTEQIRIVSRPSRPRVECMQDINDLQLMPAAMFQQVKPVAGINDDAFVAQQLREVSIEIVLGAASRMMV